MIETKMLCASFVLLLLFGISVVRVSAQQTTVSVFPASYTAPYIGAIFTINVTVHNVTNLYGFNFKLYYPSYMLNGSSVSEGPFLKTGGGSTVFMVPEFTDAHNETHGCAVVLCTRVPPTELGVEGDGVLVMITFNSTTSGGPSVLHLADVRLSDANATEVPCTVVDGEVKVIPEFPAVLIMPLFIIVTLAVVALLRTALIKEFRKPLVQSDS